MRQMIAKTSPVTIWLGVMVLIGGAFPINLGRTPLNCALAQGTDDNAPVTTNRVYRVGDRLEVEWNGTWYKAIILEEKDGSYKIRYDGYSSAWDEWVQPKRMRRIVAPAPTQAKDTESNTPTAGAFKVGDAVEAWNTGWYKGRIVEVGTGKNAGYYLVDYDASAIDQWAAAKNVRAIQKPKVYSGPPRAGKYLVMGYGNLSNPLHLGYFVLRGGNAYRFYNLGDELIGSGSYRFDATSKTVQWLSGPFKESKWDGKFEISREGKTHTIRVNRATIGTNSSD